MRTRLKVCCIASREEARLAIAHGADALGFVGPMPSGPGPQPVALTASIVLDVPPPVASVFLTSQTDAEGILAEALASGANTVQIVNHVDPAHYAALRRMPQLRFLQVVHVEDRGAITLAKDYAKVADAILLDSGHVSLPVPELGGTGRVHDWSISAEIVRQLEKPVFLAGGLNPGNVARAIAEVRPFGLDLCSGVRTDGKLDGAKLAAFVAAMG
ncbi:MAG: phosphoribosylanthranilate isomerase [Proteobacteria bacterium]|nr:phosphoribosylanthranilate isomerase [Pseudomonadota bacterium]